MPGGPDAAYVTARRVLLDALHALADHREALILVGAQAIYLHTGEGDLAVAPYTTDGDIALDPASLRPTPRLEDAMVRAGFRLDDQQPGIWYGIGSIEIDLLVPELVSGGGRRGARLGDHGRRAARKARGLEASLVDHALREIGSLEDEDGRVFEIAVAGPTALLIAKLHKLTDRQETPDRLTDKDALDVLRLLRATDTDLFTRTVKMLRGDSRSEEVTIEAMTQLEAFFAEPGAEGCRMAARAAAPLEDPATIAASAAALASDLLAALGTSRSPA